MKSAFHHTTSSGHLPTSKELCRGVSFEHSPARTLQVSFRDVQRLFSMFPIGGAGLGLLILRFCDAGMLLGPMLRSTGSLPFWAAAVLVVIAISLCIGAFTPFGCIASTFAQIVMLFCDTHPDPYEFALTLGVTWALFLLGPGAFSVDGRLFGRRLILPSRTE